MRDSWVHFNVMLYSIGFPLFSGFLEDLLGEQYVILCSTSFQRLSFKLARAIAYALTNTHHE